MKRDGDLKVEYLIIQDYEWMRSRRVKYRIKKSQLPWWQRNFLFNPWKEMYNVAMNGTYNRYFGLEEYRDYIRPLKTLKEVQLYLNRQDDIARRANDEWYDKLN